MQHISEPLVVEKTLNGDLYLDIMKKIIVPYIKRNGGVNKFVFWPDLASSHYSNKVLKYLEKEKVDFVKRNENPPACPEIRPIEEFWHMCKLKYYKLRNQPKTMKCFKSNWRKAVKRVSGEVVRGMFGSIKGKVRELGQYGVVTLQ